VCLLPTGEIKSALTVELEAMLDLHPLPDMFKKDAAQSAYRILDSMKPNTEDMQENLKIYKNFQGNIDLHPLSDTMPVSHEF
jgi:hypothetical protein